MSKKSKKLGNIWDLTPEEQQAQLAEFEEVERGEVDIMSLVKGNAGRGLDDNGFSAGLEALIVKDHLGSGNVHFDEERIPYKEHVHGAWPTSDSYNDEDDEQEAVVTLKMPKPAVRNVVIPAVEPEQPKKEWEKPVMEPIKVGESEAPSNKVNPVKTPISNGVRELSFMINHAQSVLNRMVIDDGIAPSSVSLDIAATEQIVESLDATQAADACVQLMHYIISLKHPSAIYEEDDFYNTDFWKFGKVDHDQYDHNRYFFMEGNGYVFCYLINKDAMNKFNKLISEKYSSTISQIMSVYVSIAYAAGTMHQAFFVEEVDYIKKFYKDNGINKQKEFHKAFIDDLNTKFIGLSEEPGDEDGVSVLPVEQLQIDTREMIEFLSGSTYFNEDEHEEDDDLDTSNGEDDFSDLAEGMDEVDHIGEYTEVNPEAEQEVVVQAQLEPSTSNTSSDDDNLTFPVIRKK